MLITKGGNLMASEGPVWIQTQGLRKTEVLGPGFSKTGNKLSRRNMLLFASENMPTHPKS
jgi:hypothetical protein